MPQEKRIFRVLLSFLLLILFAAGCGSSDSASRRSMLGGGGSTAGFATIGEFYDALCDAFDQVKPTFALPPKRAAS